MKNIFSVLFGTMLFLMILAVFFTWLDPVLNQYSAPAPTNPYRVQLLDDGGARYA